MTFLKGECHGFLKVDPFFTLWVSQGCVQMLQTDVEDTAQQVQYINIWHCLKQSNPKLLDDVGTSVT